MKTSKFIIQHYASILVFMVLFNHGDSYSLAQSVFLPNDPGVNPFADKFIQKIASGNFFYYGPFQGTDNLEAMSGSIQANISTINSMSRNIYIGDSFDNVIDELIDDQLEFQSDIDSEWIHLVTAGPMIVNYVGSLLVLASKRDFPLATEGNFTFKHIQNPSSFKQTMGQVARAIYTALYDAHRSMDKIQLDVRSVPEHLKSALNLVLFGSPISIRLYLSQKLNTITKIGNSSALIAQEIYNKFSSVQQLISEIIIANVNTEATQNAVVARIEEEIENHERERERIRQSTKGIQDEYDNARRTLDNARREYQNARDSMPSGRFFRRIFRAIVKVVVTVVIKPLQVIGCILTRCGDNAAEQAGLNAIKRAEELRLVLEDAEKRYEALVQQQAISQQELNAVITTLANLDINKLSEKEIIDILIKAIVQMNEIKSSWGRLLQFFSRISIEAESTQKIIADEFVSEIKHAQATNTLMDPADREMFAEMIAFTSQEIERSAHLLYIMSKTYYDVSAEYMLGQIASMTTLLLLDTDTERSAYLQQISTSSQNTTAKIIQLGQDRHNQYRMRNQIRVLEYERFLQSIPREELEMILS